MAYSPIRYFIPAVLVAGLIGVLSGSIGLPAFAQGTLPDAPVSAPNKAPTLTLPERL